MRLQVFQHLKPIFVLITLAGSGWACSAQTLFFDDLHTSTWTSDTSLCDSTIWKATKFSLQELNVPKDSIKSDLSLWTFRDSLTITRFHAATKTDQVIGTYKYEVQRSRLLLFFKQDTPSECLVGVVSGGNFVLLTRDDLRRR